MLKLFRLFKKFEAQSLPQYKHMTVEDIPIASTVLFYGGNKLTEMFGNRVYRHPYRPPAFHAALYLGNGEILNVGKFRTVQPLRDEFRSTRRVDVIIYNITNEQRQGIAEAGYQDITRPKVGVQLPDYGFLDYIRFGVKWWKPTRKDFCSENVVENMAVGGVRVSVQEPYNTAPWHLLEFAEENPTFCKTFTLHVGKDFRP